MTDPSERTPGQRFRKPPNTLEVVAEVGHTAGSADGLHRVDATPSIERYRTSRPVVILVALVALALVASLIWFGTRPDPGGNGTTPSPSPSPTGPTGHTPAPGGQGVMFESSLDSAVGYWEILSHTWDASGTGVTIKMRITLDAGNSFSWSFFALDNTAADLFYPVDDSGFDTGKMTLGDVVTGTVKFKLPKGPCTIYLANRNERQLAALVIEG